MADFDLEDLVDVEQTFYNSGYEDGYAHGRIHGLIEGRALGKEKGFEMWEEIAFYEGFAGAWIALYALTGRTDDRVMHHARQLLDITSHFPRVNPSTSLTGSDDDGVDISALQRQTRSRYKLLCATLGVRPSLRAADVDDDRTDDADGANRDKRKKNVWKVEGPPIPKSEQGLSF